MDLALSEHLDVRSVVIADEPIDTHRHMWLLALFLGASLAAVTTGAPPEVKRECRYVYLTGGGGSLLTGGGGSLLTAGRQCELKVGSLRVSLPARLDAVLDRIVRP
jgi:hypothetical protein